MHLKISYVDNDEECVVYKDEVPDTKKMTNSIAAAAAAASHQPASTTNHTATSTTTTTAASAAAAAASSHPDGLSNGSNGGVHNNANDGIVITLDSCKALSGDIKVEFYMKPRISRKKTLFSFWFNTYFVSERENDGKSDQNKLLRRAKFFFLRFFFCVCAETNSIQCLILPFFHFHVCVSVLPSFVQLTTTILSSNTR